MNHDNNNNNNSNTQSKSQQQQEESSNLNNNNDNNNNDFNPYAILNLPNHQSTTNDQIQKSYKLLSRSFHPDKQPIQSRNDAQQYFIQLKSAYDILMDPVQKFAYDLYGMDGVLFLKRQSKLYHRIEHYLLSVEQHTTSKHTNTKEETSNNNIIRTNPNIDKATKLLTEALQYHNFQIASLKLNKPKLSGSVKVKCNTTHSTFLQEGIEPFSLDVDETNVALSISSETQSHQPIPSTTSNNNNSFARSFLSTVFPNIAA